MATLDPVYEVRGSHGDEVANCGLLGNNVVWTCT
jgi:hypothetical protein